ncbi:hypothetical protein OM076_25875 [Solirubrobacter ginsenosidimutans]|uniref:Uncharacterized protein n=1 Tax=Solirubrobacter ginsenosidimutans TaxID=490573 RepID=A0A9X3S1R4_9ACTN|nr:hypothetical protein [Solirubrobacter ginsenosidimutans]MDA0163725.1 hypothetical protein [Solirubrobacter ginsenosidimutans]
MRILLVAIALLVFPAVAEARPLCGPVKARTLAGSDEARLYRSGSTIRGCAPGNRSVRLGSHAAKWRVAGHFVAVVDRGALRYHDLVGPQATERLNAADGKVRAFSASSTGRGAWIEDRPDGVREVRAGRGPETRAIATGRNIASDFVYAAGRVVSWQQGGYVRLGINNWDAIFNPGRGGLDDPLGTAGNVALSLDDDAVIARYRGGRRVRLGVGAYGGVRDEPSGGIDAIRVSGSTAAVRSNSVGDRYARGGIGVIDLIHGTARTSCQARAVWNFVLTSGGSVACVIALDSGGNRVVSEGAVLDEGDQGVTDLDERDGNLVWRHDGETRTAPLPAAQPIDRHPCGPVAAGTFEESDGVRVYARGGVAKLCTKDGRRSVSLGSSAPVLSVTLWANFAAVVRDTGDGQSLRVYEVHTGAPVGNRLTGPGFGETKFDFSGFVVTRIGTQLQDTLGTPYRVQEGPVLWQLTGRVVSWGDYSGRLYVQEVRDDRALSRAIAGRNGTLLERDGVTIALEGNRIVARRGEIEVPLGRPSTACMSRNRCEGISMLGVTPTSVVTLDRAGVVLQHDLVTGATTRPCPARARTFSIGEDGVKCS